MQITLGKLDTAWASIMSLANNKQLPSRAKTATFRLMLAAEPEVAKFRNTRDRDLIMKLGVRIESDQWHIPDEIKRAEYAKQIEALALSEVHLPDEQFSTEEVSNTLTALEMFLFAPWIKPDSVSIDAEVETESVPAPRTIRRRAKRTARKK